MHFARKQDWNTYKTKTSENKREMIWKVNQSGKIWKDKSELFLEKKCDAIWFLFAFEIREVVSGEWKKGKTKTSERSKKKRRTLRETENEKNKGSQKPCVFFCFLSLLVTVRLLRSLSAFVLYFHLFFFLHFRGFRRDFLVHFSPFTANKQKLMR